MEQVAIGSIDWLERYAQIDADTVDLLADILREKWLALGGDDRPWDDWQRTVHKKYSEDELADMRAKVAAGTCSDTR